MALQSGDWVRTDSGQQGKVVLVSDSGVTAYIEVKSGERNDIVSCLVSQLTKIDPPAESGQSSE